VQSTDGTINKQVHKHAHTHQHTHMHLDATKQLSVWAPFVCLSLSM